MSSQSMLHSQSLNTPRSNISRITNLSQSNWLVTNMLSKPSRDSPIQTQPQSIIYFNMYIIKYQPLGSWCCFSTFHSKTINRISDRRFLNNTLFLPYFSCNNISFEIHSSIKTKLCPPCQPRSISLSRLPLNLRVLILDNKGMFYA